MRHWLTRDDPRLCQGVIKRFEPSHWTVDFPRGTMACVVSHPDENRLTATVTFGRKGDLVGLIFATADTTVHIGHRRHTVRDYSRCTLRFHWRSNGVAPLDEVNGPTLTIEGADAEGQPRTWYVRLWNYAVGSATEADIVLPFDELRAGYVLGPESEHVDVRQIDRLFISLVPPGFVEGSGERFQQPPEAEVEISAIECVGSGSCIAANDTFVPEHRLRICTAYDDCYNLTPERVIDGIERLGYRDLINHYVGMSHFPALLGSGFVNPAEPMCRPARRWHESFAALAKARGYEVIWSLSMELLEELCPEQWKQRAWDGVPARTGYVPPSTLLSPAVTEAVDYLASIATAFVTIGVSAGLAPKVQIGEPWWWVRADHAICLYDAASSARWPQGHEPIQDVRVVSAEQAQVLDEAGRLLSSATSTILARVRSIAPDLQTHLLAYLPSLFRHDAPDIVRANLPLGWQSPAFDVLQLEDYEWVTEGLIASRFQALERARSRLKHQPDTCHYLSGFVSDPKAAGDWNEILAAAQAAFATGFKEVLLWALPQVFRDSLTIFEGDSDVQAFRDELFPLEVGLQATVEPCFSTTITTSPGGFEYRNADWQQARLRFDVGPGLRSIEDVQRLLNFFRSMRGNALGFRFQDPTDFSSSAMTGTPTANDVEIGTGDGLLRRFALIKRYGDGELRRITRPKADSVLVSINGAICADWLLADDGVIEFSEPPSAGTTVTAGFLFDVPVRFEEPKLKVGRSTRPAGELISVPLIEVREA